MDCRKYTCVVCIAHHLHFVCDVHKVVSTKCVLRAVRYTHNIQYTYNTCCVQRVYDVFKMCVQCVHCINHVKRGVHVCCVVYNVCFVYMHSMQYGDHIF